MYPAIQLIPPIFARPLNDFGDASRAILTKAYYEYMMSRLE